METTMNLALSSDPKAFWKEMISEYHRQNTSQAEFCRQKGLIYSTFGYWKRKLESNSPPEVRFLELPPDLIQNEEKTAVPAAELNVEGISIRIYNGADPEMVKRIIREIKR